MIPEIVVIGKPRRKGIRALPFQIFQRVALGRSLRNPLASRVIATLARVGLGETEGVSAPSWIARHSIVSVSDGCLVAEDNNSVRVVKGPESTC